MIVGTWYLVIYSEKGAAMTPFRELDPLLHSQLSLR
jgi:hypothetical protein